ncbi:hypothetical protein V7332_06355 [Bacillus thuringiensis]|uniref:hypothetical protein n=1 Tax=Bacillus thuringiensis TaxID=1428 RepID=UPI002FFE524E
MLILSDNFLKSLPGFVALVTGLITLISFIATRIIQVFTTDKINRLFLSKVQQANLKIWSFFAAVIYFTIFFAGSGLAFNYSFNEVDITKSGTLKVFISWSAVLFLISSIIIPLNPLITRNQKKNNIKILFLIIMFNLTMGFIIYLFVFNQIIYMGISLNKLSIVTCLPLMLVTLYSITFSQINDQKPPIKYLISSVSEEKIKVENLVHGHIIDEKRTVCFPKNSKSNDIFYLCDFSAEIYLKYEKENEHEQKNEHEDNKFALSSTNKEINRKVYKKEHKETY